MTPRIAVFLLLLPLFAAPSRAGPAPPSAADTAVIEQCVKASKGEPSSCLGRVQKPCLETETGQTTYGAVLCAERETAVWAARARATADATIVHLAPERLKLIRAAHAAWIKYRNAECAYEASVYLGGSLAKVVAADCILRETGLRALDLEADATLNDGEE